MKRVLRRVRGEKPEGGFTTVELILACVIFPIIVVGISDAIISVRSSYTVARQLNEIYAVLSACPEIDRALEYSSLSTGTNCYPNNSFLVENQAGERMNTYSPDLTVTGTGDLPGSDPLSGIPDSKVVEINVDFLPPASSTEPLSMRMLITRNGIGQL
jgi:hypothetical protein